MRIIALSVLAVCVVAAVLLRGRYVEAQLLRGDPRSIQSDAPLMGFATARGRPLFDAHCASCHGPAGHGNRAKGIPDLTDDEWLYGTGQVIDIERVIYYGIRSHHPKAWNLAIMPAFGRPRPSEADAKIAPLAPPQIRDLIEFIFHEQGLDADGAASARGASLYLGAGGCYDCHSTDLRGDSAIGVPNLIDKITLYGDGSRQALFMSIANGRQGMCPAWVGQISATGIRELALYVYSLSHSVGSKHDH
ncbi:MAG: cytochrome c oxidase cbb3-type subunit [Gammaproteobacteria bacterium]|jgi:cytochrome c oxidase cbb3-type subunit 3|nr:cytochrome c oxidase cbb3-type subunit [Gammaproteobacteria bacterium]